MRKMFATLLIVLLVLGVSISIVDLASGSPSDEDIKDAGVEDGDSEKAEDAEKTGEAKDDADDVEEETKATEHSREEEDEEERKELSYEKDEEDDLHIMSDDNEIEFEREKPQIHFKYLLPNKTEVKFEADDFALIEFLDRDGDNQIGDNETLKKLKFGDNLLWSFNYSSSVENNNTIITVTYYLNTTEYEIWLVMRVYQKRVALNDTLVFDVDGGADEVKFDLIIDRWTWANESSKLALLMELESEVEGAVALESASINEDQILIKLDSVKIKVSWVKKATIFAADGNEEVVNVTVAYKSTEIELEASEIEMELEVYFIYPHFGQGKLVHDPSIGIEDDPLMYIFNLVTPELLLGTAITATVVAAVAFGFSRRKKKLPSLGKVPASMP